nr:hypothetical protein [Tanacetum cinerariifolium]
MEAGSKDRPPMLAPGSPITTTERIHETYKNVSQEIRDQLNAEAEAVQIILTRIDNDIYLTVDACLNSQELKIVSYHKLYDILKQHQHEVNEIKAEKIARVANLLTLIAQQPYSKPKDPNELFHKLLGDLKKLAEYENSQSRDRSNFLNNNEDHSNQNKESLENSCKEIATSNSNEEKEEPSQDSDIRQLIREECCVEASEEQKQKMKDTMLELIEICRQKELYCMHDNVEDLIESALNSKLFSINSNSQHAPILSTKETEHPLSMGYENLNTTPKTESDEIIKFGVEELVPILNENDVTLEDKRECDMSVCEDSSALDVCDNHSEIFSDSNNDDDISSYDDDFEDVEYVEASLSDLEIVSVEEENDVQQEEEEIDLEDISQIQDVDL